MYCNFHVITDLNIDIYIVLLFKDLIGRNSNFIVLYVLYFSFICVCCIHLSIFGTKYILRTAAE